MPPCLSVFFHPTGHLGHQCQLELVGANQLSGLLSVSMVTELGCLRAASLQQGFHCAARSS